MNKKFQKDIDKILSNTCDFAEIAILNNSDQITGFYFDEYSEASFSDVRVAGSNPFFIISLTLFKQKDIKFGDTLFINDVNFVIKNIKKYADGRVEFELEKQELE